MFRSALTVALFLLVVATACSFAQVQTVGEVSFAVPDGWTYQNAGDAGLMVIKEPPNFWIMGVYTPMPSSGDASRDIQAAWQRIVLAGPDYKGMPALPYYETHHTVGYPSRRAEGCSTNGSNCTWLYVLEAGQSFIPLIVVSTNRAMLDAKEHIANALIGSVRLAPLKAAPIKTNITIADLVGYWTSGMANSISYYNSSTGRYVGSSNSFYGAGYQILPNGTFTYKMSGMSHDSVVRDDDSGTVELAGEFITFRGHNHVTQYRFLNIQQAIDGSTVLTVLPPGDLVHMNIIRDSQYYTRAVKK